LAKRFWLGVSVQNYQEVTTFEEPVEMNKRKNPTRKRGMPNSRQRFIVIEIGFDPTNHSLILGYLPYTFGAINANPARSRVNDRVSAVENASPLVKMPPNANFRSGSC